MGLKPTIFTLVSICLLLTPADVRAQFRFDATLRIDLHHVGDQKKERYMVDALRLEGPWPGSRTHLQDNTGQGSTLVEVESIKQKGKLIFSRGFCTIFGEWRTTNEAKSSTRVFSETVRLPLPTEEVLLKIKTRNKKGKMVRVLTQKIEPSAPVVSRERRRWGLKVHRLHHSGPPSRSLDIVILGDGYQAWQMGKYLQDARRFARVLLAAKPFAHYAKAINIWGVESPSRQSGVDEPRKGIFRDTALSMSFNTFGSARYLMTTDNKAVRDVAANAPYDAVYIMSNTSRYGGGGIYNLYSSFVSDNEYDEYVFVHEFGHSFAGLADEYYTSQVAYSGMYPRGVEPWEPNITAQKKRARIKWKDLINPDTKVPTAEHDPQNATKVGLYEGAGYSAKGLYRSFVDCKMFGKGHHPFCPVCMRAVSHMVERYLE